MTRSEPTVEYFTDAAAFVGAAEECLAAEPVVNNVISTVADRAARCGAPVYTPAERRGHGYASAAVAQVSRRLLAEGARVCLFTDRANPVSNHVYAELGFTAVTDMANHTVAESATVRAYQAPSRRM